MERRNRLKPANGPVRLDRIAESLLDPVVARAGFSSTQMIAAWPDIVGPELAARSRPEKLRWPKRYGEADEATGDSKSGDGATLVVRAEGIDALEIQHMASNIAARINAIFGWRAVSRIAIRQGPVAMRTEKGASPPAGPTARPPEAPQVDRDNGLDAVEDDQLRSALSRLGSQISGATDTKV